MNCTGQRNTPDYLIGFIMLLLAACGGGGGSTPPNPPPPPPPLPPIPISSFELIDPTPGVGDHFGQIVVLLTNGNIVVSDPDDSSVAAQNGAVHLYDPVEQTLIASLYGDTAGDELGETQITALPNGNFVVVSSSDDEGGIINAGSVRLVDGESGEQIAVLSGDSQSDSFGSQGVVALPNSNFVILSPFVANGGSLAAGLVQLVNGAMGAPIGAPLMGDTTNDLLGNQGAVVLPSGNYLVISSLDNVVGNADAGSVILVDGTNGAEIRRLNGNDEADNLGSGNVTVLANGNYLVVSPNDDIAGILNAGSVRLMDGESGIQIEAALVGDQPNDRLGSTDVKELANGNYVVASEFDDEGGVLDAGSVRLMNGADGTQIRSISGSDREDRFGSTGITPLANGHYIVASPSEDFDNIVDAGSVRLIDGVTGFQRGTGLVGDAANDRIGSSTPTELLNGNYVVTARFDDVGGIENVGSVRLMDGTNGEQIGVPLIGDIANDQLGSLGTIVLSNGDYVVVSSADDEDGLINAGSIRLMDGESAEQINTINGDSPRDSVGNAGATALPNGNYLVISTFDDEGGVIDAGSVRLVNGSTGTEIGSPIVGRIAQDMVSATITVSADGQYFLLSFRNADNNGFVDSGLVRLVAP